MGSVSIDGLVNDGPRFGTKGTRRGVNSPLEHKKLGILQLLHEMLLYP